MALPTSVSNPNKPPRMRQMNKDEFVASVPVEKNFILHIKMRKQLNKNGSTINIVDHFKLLLSRMMVEVPNLYLIPFEETSKKNYSTGM
jgi:hypothetical protein